MNRRFSPVLVLGLRSAKSQNEDPDGEQSDQDCSDGVDIGSQPALLLGAGELREKSWDIAAIRQTRVRARLSRGLTIQAEFTSARDRKATGLAVPDAGDFLRSDRLKRLSLDP